jgi:hypothetical protein
LIIVAGKCGNISAVISLAIALSHHYFVVVMLLRVLVGTTQAILTTCRYFMLKHDKLSAEMRTNASGKHHIELSQGISTCLSKLNKPASHLGMTIMVRGSWPGVCWLF